MPAITDSDLARMRDGLFFDGAERHRKLTRFWALLLLAASIAAAGVVADSTATVIGAMIVAPLMTPILGTVLSMVTGDGRNLIVSLLLVGAGAVAVVVIGYALGNLTPVEISAETNSQVAGRVHPRLIDLLAAIATGAVGAFALVRDDVSDTLPGVAIAISLVPPLAVVGLTLESGAEDQSMGALLLFFTNVGAILLSGVIVMGVYHVQRTLPRVRGRSRLNRHAGTLVVVVFVAILAIPLGIASSRFQIESLRRSDVARIAEEWAAPAGWEVVKVDTSEDAVVVRAIGPLPAPEPDALRAALDEQGLESLHVRLELAPEELIDLPGS